MNNYLKPIGECLETGKPVYNSKEHFRLDFEKSIAVPADVWWDKEANKYRPLPNFIDEPTFQRLAHERNDHLESYADGRRGNEQRIYDLSILVGMASEIIESIDPQTSEIGKAMNEFKMALLELRR